MFSSFLRDLLQQYLICFRDPGLETSSVTMPLLSPVRCRNSGMRFATWLCGETRNVEYREAGRADSAYPRSKRVRIVERGKSIRRVPGPEDWQIHTNCAVGTRRAVLPNLSASPEAPGKPEEDRKHHRIIKRALPVLMPRRK